MIWLVIYFVAGVFFAARRPVAPSIVEPSLRRFVLALRVVIWPAYAYVVVRAFLINVRDAWNA